MNPLPPYPIDGGPCLWATLFSLQCIQAKQKLAVALALSDSRLPFIFPLANGSSPARIVRNTTILFKIINHIFNPQNSFDMIAKFSTFLLLLIYSNTLLAQWTSLGGHIIPINYKTWSLKIAEDHSIWALSTYDKLPLPASHYPIVSSSKNGGISWTHAKIAGTGGFYGNDIAPIDSLHAFLSIDKHAGLYKTKEGGEGWEHVDNYPYIPLLAHFFDANDGWVLGSDNTQPYSKVFSVTDDGGETWTHIGGNAWVQPAGTSLPPQPFSSWYGLTFSVESLFDVAGESIILGKIEGSCWISNDRGYHWSEVATPLTPLGLMASNVTIKDSLTFMVVGDIEAATFNSKPTKSFATKDGGKTWIEGSPDITAGATHFIPGSESVFIISGPHNYGSGSFGTVISYNFGADWLHIDDQRLLAMDFNSAGNGVASCCNGLWDNTTGDVYKWEFDLFPTAEREVAQVKGLDLWPNPASEFVNIHLPETATDHFAASLFDGQGKLVRSFPYADKQMIGLQGLAPGMYLVKVVNEEQVYIGKFLKQ